MHSGRSVFVLEKRRMLRAEGRCGVVDEGGYLAIGRLGGRFAGKGKGD